MSFVINFFPLFLALNNLSQSLERLFSTQKGDPGNTTFSRNNLVAPGSWNNDIASVETADNGNHDIYLFVYFLKY